MSKSILHSNDGAKLNRLREQHVAASRHAAQILKTHGMDSPEFAEADRATGL